MQERTATRDLSIFLSLGANSYVLSQRMSNFEIRWYPYG